MNHPRNLLLFAGAIISFAACAWQTKLPKDGYVYLVSTDAGGESGFLETRHWSEQTLDPGRDYLVQGDYLRLRTPTSQTCVFPGRSLTLDNGTLLCKMGGGADRRVRVDDLRIYGGQLIQGESDTHIVEGSITVFGNDSDNRSFLSVSGANSSRVFDIRASISGSAQSVVSVRKNGDDPDATDGNTGSVLIAGDTSEFYGSYHVYGDPGTPILLRAASVAALGFKQSSASPFLTLEAGGTFETTGQMDLSGVCVKVIGTGTLAAQSVAVSSATTIRLPSSNGSASTLAVSGAVTGSGKARLLIDADAAQAISLGGQVRLIRAADISEAMFELRSDDADADAALRSAASLSVEQEGGVKWLVASISRTKVYDTSSGRDESSFYGAGGWEDHLPPSMDKEYLIRGGTELRVSESGRFGGYSLSILSGADLALKGAAADFNMLYLHPGGKITARKDGDGNIVTGRAVSVGNNMTSHAASDVFMLECDVENSGTGRTLKFNADLSGGGMIGTRWFEGRDGKSSPVFVSVGGNNSSFAGCWWLCNQYVATVFASAEAIGSATPSREGAIQISNNATWRVKSDIDLPAGLGVKLFGSSSESASGGTISVDAKKRLVVNSPLSGNGPLRLAGGGEVVLAAEGSIAADEGGRRYVTLGCSRLTVRNPRALGTGAVLRLADSGSGNRLRVECEGGLELGRNPFQRTGSVRRRLRLEPGAFVRTAKGRRATLLVVKGGTVDSVDLENDIELAFSEEMTKATLGKEMVGGDLVVYADIVRKGLVIRLRGPVPKERVPGEFTRGYVDAPYRRYEADEAKLTGPAVVRGPAYDQRNVAAQASDLKYVELSGVGAAVEWTVAQSGMDGVTLRFTMPDEPDGWNDQKPQYRRENVFKGSLDVYVNGVKRRIAQYGKTSDSIPLSSYWMWQYFGGDTPHDEPGWDYARFAFDEVHFILEGAPLEKGDVLRLVNADGKYPYGVDFVELEKVPSPIAKPDGALSVADFGTGRDAIDACFAACAAQKKTMYFPAGVWEYYKEQDDNRWLLHDASGVKITGAGMWHTNLHFPSSKSFGGGVGGDRQASGTEFCHMYLSSMLRSRFSQNAVYKGIMEAWGDNASIHDLWVEHFECGVWLGDYISPAKITNNSRIFNCRFRNNLADGINFCQGSSNTIVEHCSFRGNGDDAIAIWNNDACSAPDSFNITIRHNTVECNWRAGGIAVFGGDGHLIEKNIVKDCYKGSGIRLNTDFGGYKFNNTREIRFRDNTIWNCGTSWDCYGNRRAAVDVTGGAKNLVFENTTIAKSQSCALQLTVGSGNSLRFINTVIDEVGGDGGREPVYAIQIGDAKPVFDGLSYSNIDEELLTNKPGNITYINAPEE